jgi:hypothetical protein
LSASPKSEIYVCETETSESVFSRIGIRMVRREPLGVCEGPMREQDL